MSCSAPPAVEQAAEAIVFPGLSGCSGTYRLRISFIIVEPQNPRLLTPTYGNPITVGYDSLFLQLPTLRITVNLIQNPAKRLTKLTVRTKCKLS